MQAAWKLNGLDVSHWLREGGVTYGEVYRQSRSIITLDGTLEQRQVVKRTLTLEFMTLRDSKAGQLQEAIQLRPVTMEYTERDGKAATKLFYVTSFTGGVKTIRGGITYWSGLSVGLEER